ncbi:MAG: cupredoxin domain-containing protein [Patescibacteria group bacterium]
MDKNQSIALVAVIVVVGLFFYFNDAQAPTQQNTQQQSQSAYTPPTESAPATPTSKPAAKAAVPVAKNTVSYAGGAFSPMTLNIKAGESVKFVNNSTLSMWVMSGPDTYHSEYPSFNQERTVGKGGVYNFTFVTPGTYQYFNKNNPSAKGLIVVTK